MFRLRPGSHVEAHVQHVAVLDDVRLALEPLQAAPRRLRVRAGLDEVVPADHLGADEAARDVRVDRRRRRRARSAPRRSVQARVSFSPAVKKRDQVERVEQPADDLVERRRPVAERGRLLLASARRARPRASGRSRPARSRPRAAASSSAARARGGSSPRPVGERLARPRGARAAPRARRPPCAAPRRPTSPACAPARAAARRGRGRRRAARAGASRGRPAGVGVGREPVEHGEQRVDLAEVAEQRRARAGDVDDADRGGRDLLRADDLGDAVEPLVGDRSPCRRSTCPRRSRTP